MRLGVCVCVLDTNKPPETNKPSEFKGVFMSGMRCTDKLLESECFFVRASTFRPHTLNLRASFMRGMRCTNKPRES